MLKELALQISKLKEEEHNALCPKCLEHWDFDEHHAWCQLSKEEREQLTEHGYLLVICEDCDYSEDLDEFLDLVFEHDLFVTFSR